MVKNIISASEAAQILDRLVSEVASSITDPDNLVVIGVQRRGADLAERIAKKLERQAGRPIKCGSVDINLYRDDWTRLADRVPHIGQSSIPCNLDRRVALLVDDVLFSGRTIRAAMEALMDYGRPDAVRLLAFVDRGHRELPICADYVGKKITTEQHWHIDVLTMEHDGEDGARMTIPSLQD